MKKYLMMGAAAHLMGASFTSCSNDNDLYDPQANAAKFLQAYESAFIEVFGTPDANQTWGFGDVAASRMTRTENANANEWADPNKAYGGLLVPPALTDEQKAVVKKYFQTHPNLGYEDPGWSNYFIQQVYKGHTDVPEGCATPEAYLAANGSTLIIASDHMDHLIAVDTEKEIYDHINNFNHGDCSTNGNVLDNGGNANDGPFHSDKIMYMMNSTTKSFGYHNSDGSLYHTEYTGLVSYKTIMAAMGAEANCLEDGWNRSFMGFDFEQMVGSSVYDPICDWQHYTAPENQVEGVVYFNNFPVLGYKTFEFEGKTYNFLNSNTNMYAADKNDNSYVQKNGSYSTTPGKANWNDKPNNAIIRDLLSKGYLPYSDTLKDWVKVGGTADGYFSDWIVTLTEAKAPVEKPDYRIIAEDLTVADSGNDFDFNDVVFDVYYDKTDATKAKVRLQAAGGTLPLEIRDAAGVAHEVHEVYGVNTTDMVNTGAGPDKKDKVYEFDVTINKNDAAGDDGIKIFVNKGGNNPEQLNFIELTAEVGHVAAKVKVDDTYEWCRERVDIETVYPNFPDYVQNPDNYAPNAGKPKWWE